MNKPVQDLMHIHIFGMDKNVNYVGYLILGLHGILNIILIQQIDMQIADAIYQILVLIAEQDIH